MDWIFYFFEKNCSKCGFAASNGQNAKNERRKIKTERREIKQYKRRINPKRRKIKQRNKITSTIKKQKQK